MADSTPRTTADGKVRGDAPAESAQVHGENAAGGLRGLRIITPRRIRLVFAALAAVVSVLAVIFLVALSSVTTNDDAITVRLSSPRVFGVETSSEPPWHITLAVAPVVNAGYAYPAWLDLAEYLGEKLSVTVTLLQRRTYEEVNELLESQEVEIALVCSGPYVDLRQRGVVHMLVVPRVRGEVVSRSYIIVDTDSSFLSFEDLRGHSFAFSDPLSNSGALYPTYHLLQIGETPRNFFSRIIYTYGHDRSVLAVLDGVVEGAAVDSAVVADMVGHRPEIMERIRVIHRSEPFGINPIVVPAALASDLKSKLRSLFLSMHEHQQGQAILSGLGIEAFELGDPENYLPVEQVRRALAE